MNYYVDFDNTLYETSSLTPIMVEAIINSININNKEEIEEIKGSFNATTGNIYLFAQEIANRYKINPQEVVQNVKNCIANSRNLTYEDGKIGRAHV